MLSPLSRLLHLESKRPRQAFVPPEFFAGGRKASGSRRFPLQPLGKFRVDRPVECEEARMKKALAILATVATVGTTTMSAPADARHFGHFGPGLAFGLAAGALTAGAIAAAGAPYYYGPGPYYGPSYYGYYGPDYYYGPGPYAYWGGPVIVRHRYWRHHYYW
jgi:hypothetical protein